MPKFIVSEMYRLDHEVEAKSASEAISKVFEDADFQYSVELKYIHQPGGPSYEYVSESTDAVNLNTYETTQFGD